MADRYWRGGSGTWDASTTTNWSTSSGGSGGASVPTAADSVFFDQAGTYTVTLTGALTCLDFTVNAGTVTFTSTGTPTISGSMSLVSGTVWSGTGTITFNATTTGKTIATGGTTINGSITFNGVGGGWTLGSALTTGTGRTTTLTNGALSLGSPGFSLSTGIFSSNNTNTRSIAFGTGNIILTSVTALTTVLSMATATGFTYTSSGTYGSTTGCFQATMSTTRTFTFGTTGGTSSNAPSLYLVSGSSVATLTTGSYFNEINFGTTAFTIATTTLNVNSIILSATGVYTALTLNIVGSGTLTHNSISVGTLNLLAGTTTIVDVTCTTFNINGANFSFTSGTLTPSSFTITSGSFTYGGTATLASTTFTHTAGTATFNKSYTSGGAAPYSFTAGSLVLADGVTLSIGSFNSDNTNTRSIAFGSASAGNINLINSSSGFLLLSMATLTGFTYTGPGGFTVPDLVNTKSIQVGATAGGTSSNAPNLTFTTGSAVATLSSASWFNKLDYGSTSFTHAASTLNVNSITLSSSGTYTALILNLRGSGTVTYNGRTTAAVTVLSGSPTISGTVACTTFTVDGGAFNFTSGTITPSTSFSINSGSFTYNGGTLSAVATFTHTAGTSTFNYNYSLTATGTYTLTAGSLTLADGVTLTTGIFSSNGSGTRSIAFGSTTAGNINLTHTTAATVVLSMATLTGFTYTGLGGFTVADMNNTRTFTCGTTAGGASTNAPNLTFAAGASVATITTAGWFNKLDYGSTSFTQAASTLNVNSITLSSGGTYTALILNLVGSGTLTYNGKTTAAVTLIAGSPTISGTVACTTFTVDGGAFNFTSGTITPSTSFVMTSGSFTYNGGTLSAVATFTHTAGTVTFNYNYSLTATGTYTFTAGTLTLADGVTLTTGIFSSSNSNTRSIAFGSASAGNINLATTSAGTTVLSMATATNFILTGPGGFTTDASVTRTLVFGTTGGSSTNAPNLTLTGSGTSIVTLTTNSWFNNLAYGSTAFTSAAATLNISGTLTLSAAGNGTFSNLIIVGQGANIDSNTNITLGNLTCTNGVTLINNSLTLASNKILTHNSGTINLNGFDLTAGSYAGGTAAAPISATRGITFGSNFIYLTKTTAGIIIDLADYTGFSCSGNGGFSLAATVARTFGIGNIDTSGVTIFNNAVNLFITSGSSALTLAPATYTFCYVNMLNFTGFTGSIVTGVSNLSVGSLVLSSGGTFTNLTPRFQNSSNGIFDCANNSTLLSIYFAQPVSLANTAVFASAYGQVYLSEGGILNLNGFDIICGTELTNVSGYVSVPSTNCSIIFGTNNIYCKYITANFPNNFTITGTTTGGIVIDPASFQTSSFGDGAGGKSTNAPNVTYKTLGTGSNLFYAATTFSSNSWINKLTFEEGLTGTYATTALNVNSLELSSVATFTGLSVTTRGTGTINTKEKNIALLTVNNGSSNVTTLLSNVSVAANAITTLTSGTINLNSYTLTTGTFSSNNSTTRSIEFGNNNIVLSTTTVGANVLFMPVATNFSCSGTGGFTSTMSVTRTFTFGNVSSSGTSTNSPNLTLISHANNSIATLTTGSSFNKLDFGSTAFTIGTTALKLNGLRLSSGGTFTTLTPTMVGTGTITSNGNTTLPSLTINGTGTTTLGDALSVPTLTLTQGTLDISTLSLTSGTFASTGTATRSITGTGTYTITGSGATAFSNASATGITITGISISLTSATAKTFAGGGGIYSRLIQGGAGALTISGSNTFDNITATSRPSTISFTAGTTQTVIAFTLSGGSAGSIVTINSTTPGTRFTLSKSGSNVSVNYLNIKDSLVTGGATWYADFSTDNGNNSGWIFGAAPAPVGGLGQFFMFF